MKQLSVLLLILLIAACAPVSSPSGNPDALGTIGARAVDDSQATRLAATREAAMATVAIQQTQAAETAVAQQIMNATAQAQLATREQLGIDLLEIGVQATATKAAAVNAADATATAIFLTNLERDLDMQARLAESEMASLAKARATEAERAALSNKFSRFWLYALPVIVTVILAILAGTAAVFLAGLWKEKTAPVFKVELGENEQMFTRRNGIISPVGPARVSGNTINTPLLPAVTGEDRPASWDSFMRWTDYSRLPLGAVLGQDDGRRPPLLINPTTDAFLLIAGKNGAGKSVGGLLPYMLAMWAAGAHVVLINGRGSDFQTLRGLPNVTMFPHFENVVDLLEPLAAFLAYIRQEGTRRDGVLSQYGAYDWRQLPPGVDGGPILIAIDELLQIIISSDDEKRRIAADGRLTTAERRAAQARFDYLVGLVWSGLNQVASVNRKHAIHIVATLTDPTRSQLGDAGMAFRGQCAALAFRMKNSGASREFLNVDSSDGFPRGSVGLPTGQFIASVDGVVARCAAFYPSPTDISQFADVKRPLITPFPLSRALSDGLTRPELLTVGDDEIISGIYEEVPPPAIRMGQHANGNQDGRMERNASILDDNINRFSSPTGAAKILFVARGELEQATNPAGWMVDEARETLRYMAVTLGSAQAAEVLGLGV